MYVYIYVCIHICFTCSFAIWADSTSSKRQRWPNRNPSTRLKKLLFPCLSGLSERLPKHYWVFLLLLPLGAPGVENESLLLITAYTSDTGPRGSWARTDLEASSPMISFHSTKWCHSSFQRSVGTCSIIQSWCLWATAMTSIAQ